MVNGEKSARIIGECASFDYDNGAMLAALIRALISTIEIDLLRLLG